MVQHIIYEHGDMEAMPNVVLGKMFAIVYDKGERVKGKFKRDVESIFFYNCKLYYKDDDLWHFLMEFSHVWLEDLMNITTSTQSKLK